MFAIVVAWLTWGKHWSGKLVLSHCDSQSVVDLRQHGSSCCPISWHLSVACFFTAANNNYTIVIRHIPSAYNVIADALPRAQMPSSMHWHLGQHHWSSGQATTFFLNKSTAASLRRTYNTSMSWYTEFCRQRKWSPFPASESSLVEFVPSAASNVQYQTLKVYLVGIKHHHQLACMPDPVATSIRLPLILRGIRRHWLRLPPKPRLPITIKIIGQMKSTLPEHLDLSTDDRQMYWAAFTTTFFGFLQNLRL